jgi:uncharacterized protein YoxC
MSITAKLQSLDAQIATKILDPEVKVENALGLLQLAAYISTLLNSGGTSGGAAPNYTSYLSSLISTLELFYTEETGITNAAASSLVQLETLLNDFYTKCIDNQNSQITSLNDLQGITNAINTILGAIQPVVDDVNSKLATVNTAVATINTGVNTLNTQTTTLTAKSTSMDGKLTTIDTQLTALLAATQVNLALTPVTVTIAALNTPELLLAADPNRKYLLIQNNSDSAGITIGFTSAMTALTGMRLPVNAAFEQNSNCIYRGAIYGFKTSGNGTMSIITGVAI